MKIVMEPLRNSQETLSTENLMFLRNFQYWPRYLSFLKTSTCRLQIVKTNVNSNYKHRMLKYLKRAVKTSIPSFFELNGLKKLRVLRRTFAVEISKIFTVFKMAAITIFRCDVIKFLHTWTRRAIDISLPPFQTIINCGFLEYCIILLC